MISSQAYARIVVFSLFLVFFLGTLLSDYILPFGSIDNIYDLKRVLVLGWASLSVAASLCVTNYTAPRLSAFTLVVISSIVLIGLVSGIIGKHPKWSLIELANFLQLISVFVILSFCNQELGRTRLLKYLFLFSLFFCLAIALKFFLLLSFHFFNDNRPDIQSLVWGFMNVRFFNQLQSMLMPILCLPFLSDELKRFSKVAMFALASMWLVLLQSEARGTILALVVAGAFVLYYLPSISKKALMRPLLSSMGIGLLLWLVLIVLLPRLIFNEDIWNIRLSSSGRIDMWLYILREIPNQLWLGFGPMSFAWAEGKPIINAHPHNSLMQFLYEYGVVVFFLVIVWIFCQFNDSFKKIREGNENQLAVIIFALGSGFLYSLFCGVIVMPLSQIILVLLFALNCTANETVVRGMMSRVTWVMVTIMLTMWLLGTITDDTLTQDLFPRFWASGVLK